MPKRSHFPNVNRVKRPSGGHYHYHRITGAKLPEDDRSPAYAQAWAAEEVKAKTAARPARAVDPGSYASLCAAFKASDAWAAIGDHTRRDYGKCMDWMARQGADPRPAAELTQERCEILLDKAVSELGHRRGIYVLQFNRRLYNWVLERATRQKTWGEKNPWATIEPPAPPKRDASAPRRNRPWKPWEVIEVLFAAPVGLRRAYVLGACGCDSATAAAMRWDQYQAGAGFAMTRGKTDTESLLPVPEILLMFLEPDAARSSDLVATTIPGDAFTPRGLQKRSSEFLAAMARTGKVGEGLTFHGLRHTIGKAVAESNGTLHAIQGALQHKSPAMALYYSAQADKRRALAAVGDGLNQWFLQNRDDPVCKTLN